MASEVVRVSGHIIDSLILPKILDEIMDQRGSFEILEMHVGKRQTDVSHARIRVDAPSTPHLQAILKRIARLGAVPQQASDVRLIRAPKDGVFPAAFYSTTNLPTEIRFRGKWREVHNIEMDCGIIVNPSRGITRCIPIARVKKTDWIVCGADGVRVTPLERSRKAEGFQFMTSAVSSEKPKGRIIRQLADQMRAIKRSEKRIVFVVGPAVVHTGSGPYLEKLIKAGFVDALFAGNGVATHDIESALYGTALGVYLDKGTSARDGHDHHMRAINTIRALGGIKQAVSRGVLTKGIMHACVKRKVPYVLAGSLRDDGPLPDVITDVLKAQDAMRAQLHHVGMAIMVASTLHSIATGNMLPATVKTICVDINPAVVTKLSDRGTFQGIGIVSDTESFFRELVSALRL